MILKPLIIILISGAQVIWAQSGASILQKLTEAAGGYSSASASSSSSPSSSTCKGIGEVRLLTNAEERPGTISLKYNVKSEIICSFKAFVAEAYGYTYDDGLCTVIDPGEGTVYGNMFWRPDIFPSFDVLEEVARNKQAYGSAPFTAYKPQTPNFAFDGSIIDADMYSSQELPTPWLMVDLGEQRMIYQIHVIPRGFDRFNNVEIRIGNEFKDNGNFTSYTLMSTFMRPYTATDGTLLCTNQLGGILGRYVSLKVVVGTTHLQVLEVLVFALKK